MKTNLILTLILFCTLFLNSSYSQGSSRKTDYETSYNYALKLLINGDYDNSLVQINKSLKLNPTNADSYYVKGNIYEGKMDYQNALFNYKKAIQLNSNHIDATMKAAIIYGKMNDKPNACLYFKKACNLGNDDACTGYKRFCN
ncbi:tetratricopeptide repeat protein [Flavobacterium sp. TAB 87]|uniref:tetratricopeptide repeat protein n=1 Tax=Flavobacterium sp. TAB 87 TaxID=1729581 RepID=UPI00076BE276|nr:tetratricopeptide repeat protein [Flavobacterium sp. TAB 87]KVV16406.1 type IV pilus biogenesis/stability protein PilW [Flavobacterium sp. TAB 87]